MIRFTAAAVSDLERLKNFLSDRNSKAAERALTQIWLAIEQLDKFPRLGMVTDDPDIRQVLVRFGSSGYLIRYAPTAVTGDIIITRVWHGREKRV